MGRRFATAQWLRRLRLGQKERVAFALSGGGPLGALQVGALQALFEHGVRPDLVAGTSVGALNATFVAFDPTQAGMSRLEEIWRGLTESDLFPGGRFRASWARFLVRGNRVFENSGLARLVAHRLGVNASFEDAQIPLGVVATDLETGEERVFDSGPVLSPLLATTAMPGVFPPVEIEGRMYIDGGVADNVPIAPSIKMGATTIYVMNSTSQSHQRRPLVRPIDYLLHAFTLARSQRLSVEQSLYANHVKLVMLPTAPLDFYVPFASMEHTDRLIAIQYEQTRRFLSGASEVVIKSLPGGAVEAIAPAK